MGEKDEKAPEKAKREPEDVAKLQNGPVEDRGCTDIFCCLIFILAVVLFVIVWGMAMSNGEPKRLFAAYDSSNKSCGIDIAGKSFLYY